MALIIMCMATRNTTKLGPGTRCMIVTDTQTCNSSQQSTAVNSSQTSALHGSMLCALQVKVCTGAGVEQATCVHVDRHRRCSADCR